MWCKVVFIKQHVQNGRRSLVIPSGYQVVSVILTLNVFEMDQNGQIIRYWDMFQIGARMITLKKSTWIVLIVVQTMHRWRLISTTSNSMWLPTLTLRLWCVYLCTRAIIRLRAPCPNNSSGCALMSPYTPNQPSRLIVAEMAVDSSDLHRPVCWAGLLPKGSAKQM